MIIKIKKEIYNEQNDYAIVSEIGEVICKIAKLKKGYYIYNKLGEQVAQITYKDNYALLTIAKNQANYPGALKISIVDNQFIFSANEIEKGDLIYLESVKGTKMQPFSLWGSVPKYAYDIYEGSIMVASVAPSSDESDYYSVLIREKGNLLKIILIALATEKLNYDPKGKI